VRHTCDVEPVESRMVSWVDSDACCDISVMSNDQSSQPVSIHSNIDSTQSCADFFGRPRLRTTVRTLIRHRQGSRIEADRACADPERTERMMRLARGLRHASFL
jgi:hypothetical protein